MLSSFHSQISLQAAPQKKKLVQARQARLASKQGVSKCSPSTAPKTKAQKSPKKPPNFNAWYEAQARRQEEVEQRRRKAKVDAVDEELQEQNNLVAMSAKSKRLAKGMEPLVQNYKEVAAERAASRAALVQSNFEMLTEMSQRTAPPDLMPGDTYEKNLGWAATIAEKVEASRNQALGEQNDEDEGSLATASMSTRTQELGFKSIAFSALGDDELDVSSRLYATHGVYTTAGRHPHRDKMSTYTVPKTPRRGEGRKYLHKEEGHFISSPVKEPKDGDNQIASDVHPWKGGPYYAEAQLPTRPVVGIGLASQPTRPVKDVLESRVIDKKPGSNTPKTIWVAGDKRRTYVEG